MHLSSKVTVTEDMEPIPVTLSVWQVNTLDGVPVHHREPCTPPFPHTFISGQFTTDNQPTADISVSGMWKKTGGSLGEHVKLLKDSNQNSGMNWRL